jgi:hypothetical protein
VNRAEITIAGSRTRELARRDADGIEVILRWHPADDALSVSVTDARGEHCFDLAVERDCGLEAFHHPFAYAADRGLGFSHRLCDAIVLQPQI